MKLVYLWVNNWKCIKEQGFNFSSEVKFNFDGENLTLIEKAKSPNIFSENIEEIIGILGGNGAGKTTLLELISHLKTKWSNKPFFTILEDGGKYYLNDPQNYVINSESSIDKLEFEYEINNTRIIYYSNSVEKLSSTDPYILNISSQRNIEKIQFSLQKREVSGKDVVIDYFFKDYENQIVFILNKTKLLEKLPFNELKNKLKQISKKGINIYSKEVFVNFESLNYKEYSIEEIEEIYNYIMFDFVEKIHTINVSKFWRNVAENALKSLISAFCNDYNDLIFETEIKTKSRDYNSRIIEETNFDDLDFYEWVNCIVKEIEDQIILYEKRMPSGKFYATPKSKNPLKAVKSLINKSNLESNLIVLNGGAKFTYKYIENTCIQIPLNMYKDLKSHSDYLSNILDYSWSESLSAGESSLLKFMGRMNKLSSQIDLNEKGKNIILLIDEIETSFHPEWKRRVITFLNTFLEGIFESDFIKRKFQVIIASHSPFIASDLPRENIIYLKEGKVINKKKKNTKVIEKTFGANIHELYRDSFFLESTMGEFSLNKIKEVIEDLTVLECANRKIKKGIDVINLKKQKKEIEEKKDTIKYIINSIGEKVLSRKLKEKYREVFGVEESKEEKLNEIEQLLYSKGFKEKKIRDILMNLGDE